MCQLEAPLGLGSSVVSLPHSFPCRLLVLIGVFSFLFCCCFCFFRSQKYVRQLKGREPTLVTVKAGQEPLPFTAHFQNWNHSQAAWVDPFASKAEKYKVNASAPEDGVDSGVSAVSACSFWLSLLGERGVVLGS